MKCVHCQRVILRFCPRVETPNGAYCLECARQNEPQAMLFLDGTLDEWLRTCDACDTFAREEE